MSTTTIIRNVPGEHVVRVSFPGLDAEARVQRVVTLTDESGELCTVAEGPIIIDTRWATVPTTAGRRTIVSFTFALWLAGYLGRPIVAEDGREYIVSELTKE